MVLVVWFWLCGLGYRAVVAAAVVGRRSRCGADPLLAAKSDAACSL